MELSQAILAQWEQYARERRATNEVHLQHARQINEAQDAAYQAEVAHYEEDAAKIRQEEVEAWENYHALPWYRKRRTQAPEMRNYPEYPKRKHLDVIPIVEEVTWEGFLDWLVKREMRENDG